MAAVAELGSKQNMKSAFRIIAFISIWGCTLGATYLVWSNFGVVAGIIFFLFGAGLAGTLGMLAVMGLAKLFGIDLDD